MSPAEWIIVAVAILVLVLAAAWRLRPSPPPARWMPVTVADVRVVEIRGFGPDLGAKVMITVEVEHQSEDGSQTRLSRRSFLADENRLSPLFLDWLRNTAIPLHNSAPDSW